jgi:hypothetical protein
MSAVLGVLEKIILAYHKELNPSLWDHNILKPNIRDTLLITARAWMTFAKIPSDCVKDIVVVGGNANYNYTPLSDIDVHIMTDYTKLGKYIGATNIDDVSDYIMKAKAQWMKSSNSTKVQGYDIEPYAMNIEEKWPVGEGVYSLISSKWIQTPKWDFSVTDTIRSPTLRAKVKYYKHLIDHLISTKAPISDFKALSDKLYNMRASAIQNLGEFAFENLVFKELRNQGYLDKMDRYISSQNGS